MAHEYTESGRRPGLGNRCAVCGAAFDRHSISSWPPGARSVHAPRRFRLAPQQITSAFKRAEFDAHLPPIRLHDLRHGACSLAHAAGYDIEAISALLRHASQAITADVYTTVFEEQAAALAEGIASIVAKLRGGGAGDDSSETDGHTTGTHEGREP